MKEVIALQEYSDKYVSLYEGEIRNIDDYLANILIAKNIVRLHTDIPEDDGSGGGGTADPGYSVERQQYVEEQTIILDYDSENETWSGVLQGGYLPEAGTEIKVTLNDGPVIKATVQEDGDGLYVSLRDDENGYIDIYQNSDTGITTLYSSISFTDNEVTISAQGEFITITDDFKAAVTTASSGTQFITCTYVNSLSISHSFNQIINFIQTSNQNVIAQFINYNSPYENQIHYLTLTETNVIDYQRIINFEKTVFHADGDIGVGIYVYTLQFRQDSDPAFRLRRYDLSHGTFQNIITVGSIYG